MLHFSLDLLGLILKQPPIFCVARFFLQKGQPVLLFLFMSLLLTQNLLFKGFIISSYFSQFCSKLSLDFVSL
ncbi:hypothetical protein AOQ84DRAFT_355934 [Glonium stellatum]|uniref:Uncharacterized protein n=1 Tax=Glonium stellatum TaxID=574774 RepID=A0A8E2EV88_9PEZI|nr:hypothetical protein AOQ84DRAFT_355934 [Glonium stellatum]